MTKPVCTRGRVEADVPYANLSRRSLVAALALGILLAACAKPPAAIEEVPIEVVDIGGDPDFAPDEDPRASPRQGQLAGSLPTDFPDDLPLHLPASVDGFGQEGRGYQVAFVTSSSLESLRRSLATKLASRGWQGDVSIGESTLTKAGRAVRLSIAAARFGSRYSYTYE